MSGHLKCERDTDRKDMCPIMVDHLKIDTFQLLEGGKTEDGTDKITAL